MAGAPGRDGDRHRRRVQEVVDHRPQGVTAGQASARSAHHNGVGLQPHRLGGQPFGDGVVEHEVRDGANVIRYQGQRLGQPLFRLLGEHILVARAEREVGLRSGGRQHHADVHLGAQGAGQPDCQRDGVGAPGGGEITH